MKVDIEQSTDQFKKGLFGGATNRFVLAVSISLDPQECARFTQLAKLNNWADAIFFDYEAFVPGSEGRGLGQIRTKWIIDSLAKTGSYSQTFYSPTSDGRDTVQAQYLDVWKGIKANLEKADTLTNVTKTSFEL